MTNKMMAIFFMKPILTMIATDGKNMIFIKI